MKSNQTYVAAILLPTGEVDYRMHDNVMAESLSHPHARLGVMVFYGHTTTDTHCPTCGHHTRSDPGFRHDRPPLFVYDNMARRCEVIPSPPQPDYWTNSPTRWKITTQVEDMALVDNRRVEWTINDWLERNA